MATPISTNNHKPGDHVWGAHHDWILDAPIGAGGSSEVWLCHRKDDVKIRGAAKILLGSNKDEDTGRLQREVRLTRRVERDGGSRFLLTMLDGGHDGNERPMLIHEYAAGGTLVSECLRRSLRGWTEKETAWVGQMVLAGLSALRGAAHRDIKPENLYIVDEPEPAKRKGIKVGDTDAALVAVGDLGLIGVEPGRPEARLTREGAYAGTLGYMPSENFNAGASDVGPAGDVYALGVVLLAMLVSDDGFALPWATKCTATSQSEMAEFECQVAGDGPMTWCTKEQLAKLTPRMLEILSAMTSPIADRRPSVADAAMQLATVSGSVIVSR